MRLGISMSMGMCESVCDTTSWLMRKTQIVGDLITHIVKKKST